MVKRVSLGLWEMAATSFVGEVLAAGAAMIDTDVIVTLTCLAEDERKTYATA